MRSKSPGPALTPPILATHLIVKEAAVILQATPPLPGDKLTYVTEVCVYICVRACVSSLFISGKTRGGVRWSQVDSGGVRPCRLCGLELPYCASNQRYGNLWVMSSSPAHSEVHVGVLPRGEPQRCSGCVETSTLNGNKLLISY